MALGFDTVDMLRLRTSPSAQHDTRPTQPTAPLAMTELNKEDDHENCSCA